MLHSWAVRCMTPVRKREAYQEDHFITMWEAPANDLCIFFSMLKPPVRSPKERGLSARPDQSLGSSPITLHCYCSLLLLFTTALYYCSLLPLWTVAASCRTFLPTPTPISLFPFTPSLRSILRSYSVFLLGIAKSQFYVQCAGAANVLLS